MLATPDGKRRVVAKGVRKTTSKLAGHLELFTHSALQLAVGRNLDIITQSQVRHTFSVMRADLTRLACAYYIAELFDKCTEEEDENRPLFELLLQTMMALDWTTKPDLVLRWHELRLLTLLGYRPHLYRCAVCQEVLTEDANRFSLQLGGVVCQRDASGDRHALLMNLGAFKLLRYLQSQPLEAVETMHISESVRDEVKLMLRAYMRHVLERDLKSVAFLEEIVNV